MLKNLYGTKIVESAHAVTANRKFTKKQTRKFTNIRWVKKYKKKYSYIEYEPGAFYSEIHQTLFIHPKALKALRESDLIKSSNEYGAGYEWYQRYRPKFINPSLLSSVVA